MARARRRAQPPQGGPDHGPPTVEAIPRLSTPDSGRDRDRDRPGGPVIPMRTAGDSGLEHQWHHNVWYPPQPARRGAGVERRCHVFVPEPAPRQLPPLKIRRRSRRGAGSRPHPVAHHVSRWGPPSRARARPGWAGSRYPSLTACMNLFIGQSPPERAGGSRGRAGGRRPARSAICPIHGHPSHPAGSSIRVVGRVLPEVTPGPARVPVPPGRAQHLQAGRLLCPGILGAGG
jgi:hypothetical protein